MTDNMDINADSKLERSSWTQDITRSKDVDFGTIEMGSPEIAVFSIVNESKEQRTYKVRRRKRARVPRYVFKVADNKFSLKPNEEAAIKVEFTPLKPFETYVDYLYVYSQKLPVAKIRLHGRSIGPFIVPSTQEIRMLAIMGTVTESQVELRNHSSAPAEMYFDIDDGNSIFRFRPARSIIQGGETIAIRIQFYPPFEGSVEKDVFCLVKYQDPIVLHLIGVCGASDYTKCAPAIIRYPGLRDESKSRTSLEAYIYREWEEIVDVKPDFAVVMPPEEKCTSFLVTNKTDDCFTLMWSEDAQRIFSISPRASYLYPKETVKFKVIKNIAVYGKLQKITTFNSYQEVGPQLELDGDMAVSATIDGWLFWHKPTHSPPSCSEPWKECQIFSNSEWLESLIPLNFEMTFIGQYVHNRNCLPQMECVAVPSTLVFPIKGRMQDNFSSLFIHTKSCHLVNYEIVAPKTGEFNVKPKQGLVNQEFRFVAVHHTPRFLHVTYMECWNVALNGIVIDKTQVNLIAVINTINVFFGDIGGTINFAPAMVGCVEATHFTVRNDSPLWIELSCSTSARPSVLNVGQKKFIIAPHDNVIQKWEYCPRVCGHNYELVTITAKVITSPALRKIMEKGNGYYEEENTYFSPAGMNVCSKHSIEHGDDDFESYQKEYKIYAEILCRNTFPQMEPSYMLIDDFIATHPAVASFRLTNDTDARIPYRLLLQLECSTNVSLESCVDHSLLIDQSNYEISPSQGMLEAYQSINYTCVVFDTKMCPETYSLVMEVKQILDSDMPADEKGSTPLSKKLGTITCKGAWPKVKIVDILASKSDEFFNPLLLWKCLDLDRFNEVLQCNPDGNVRNISMRFPGQPLGSPPIYYKMKLQNLSHLPIAWDVQIQHGDIEMPPSLKIAPGISDESSRTNDGLKHLIALIQHQQNEALNLNDSSFLRTIHCCPRREQKTLDSPAHGTPSSSEECPLLSMIRILPEKGTIMPAKSENISVEVHHELEGDFSFKFLINFTMSQEEITIHQKQDTIEEGMGDESGQPALISTGSQYNMSSDEFETYNQAEDCRTLYKCKDPPHHALEDTMIFHCITNEACATKKSLHSFESSVDETCREASEILLHTLWGPEFDLLDSTSGDESTSSLSEDRRGKFIKASQPSIPAWPSRKKILSQIAPKIITSHLHSYHSNSNSNPSISNHPQEPSNELRLTSRWIKAQGVTNIVHSAILHSSSEEEIPKSKSLPPTSSRGASGLPLADKIFKKRRHSAPEPEIHQWDIQTPQIMHSLSAGNMRVPRKSSTKTSSSNTDSGSDTANNQSCYSKEEPKRKPKVDKMKIIRKIMTRARSGKIWVGWRKFFQSDPSAGPFEQLMEFDSSPKGRNSNAADDRDANKVCDAFYEAQSKVQESLDETKKRRKRRRSKKHDRKAGTKEKRKNSTKSTRKKGESAASKIQNEEYRMSETKESQKNSMQSTKKRGGWAASKLQDEEELKRISLTNGQVKQDKSPSKDLKKKRKRQGYKSNIVLKPKQCIPLGNDSESYESETEICGKVSRPKVLTDSILETIWSKYEKSSEFPLDSLRQSNQPSTTESDEDHSKEDKNEQMIFDGMAMRGSFCPDTKIASKFNLCQLAEFQSTKVKDFTTVSLKEQRVMEHIIDDLAMENEQEAPQCASGIVIQRRSLLAQFPSVGQNRESNPNPRSTQLMGNKETMPRPPLINSFKLQLTICAYDKEQENFGVHPTMYANRITLADVCVAEKYSCNQVTWIYNPHDDETFLLIVEFEDNIERDLNRIFKCINPIGLIFPKSIYPLIIQFQPKKAEPYEGTLKIKYGSKDINVQVEGRGVHERNQYCHNSQVDIPSLSLASIPEFPFWLSDERIVITPLIPRTSKASRLIFIVNKSDVPITFQWKSLTCPSTLDVMVDVSIIPGTGYVSPHQVLPLLLSISKSKMCPSSTTSEGIKHIPRHVEHFLTYSNQGPTNVDSSDLLVDFYLLNCNVMYSPACTTGDQREESNDTEKFGEKTQMYHKPLALTFGLCSERLALFNKEAPTHMCTGELQPSRFGRNANLRRDYTLQDRRFFNENSTSIKRSIGDVFEGLQWKLLNDSWFLDTIEKLSEEGQSESKIDDHCSCESIANSEDYEPLGEDHRTPKHAFKSQHRLQYEPPYNQQIFTTEQLGAEKNEFPDDRNEDQETPIAFVPAELVAQVCEEYLTRDIVSFAKEVFERS